MTYIRPRNLLAAAIGTEYQRGLLTDANAQRA